MLGWYCSAFPADHGRLESLKTPKWAFKTMIGKHVDEIAMAIIILIEKPKNDIQPPIYSTIPTYTVQILTMDHGDILSTPGWL